MKPSRHHQALPPGYKLHWYEVLGILGQGGFGITYLGRDTNLDQKVAIKEFLPIELATRSADSQIHPLTDNHTDTFGWGLNRFLTEAKTLARFRHPNIVRVLSVFEANNSAYMVMEYEDGEELTAALRSGRVQGEASLKAVVYPLLDGLRQVHESGFIHRDIKPENIFLRDDGSPVLLDFGSARHALGAETRTLTALVTPGYAPFEQYDQSQEGEGKQGPWTDIYALGATLYKAVTGNGPPDAMARVNAVLEGKDILVPSGDVAVGEFSTKFLEAIDAALCFRPTQRPQSVRVWREMLGDGPMPEIGLVGAAPSEYAGGSLVAAAGDHLHAAPTEIAAQTGTTPIGLSGPIGAPAPVEATESDEIAPAATQRSPESPAPAGKVGKRAGFLAAASALLLVGVAAFWWGALDKGRDDVGMPEESRPRAVAPEPSVRGTSGVVPKTMQARTETASSGIEQSGPPVTHPKVGEERTETASSGIEQSGPPVTHPKVGEERVVSRYERVIAQRQNPPDTAKSERETQKQPVIATLLQTAARDVKARRLSAPQGNNALARYREVLRLEPGNEAAKAGLKAIVAAYVILVDESVKAGKLDRATYFLAKAKSIGVENSQLTAWEKSLEQLKADARQAAHTTGAPEAEKAQKAAEREAAAKRAEESLSALADRKAEAERQLNAASRRQSIALLKVTGFNDTNSRPAEQIFRTTHVYIRAHQGLELKYSYYDPGTGPRLPQGTGGLWPSGSWGKEPDIDRLKGIAAALEVDEVLVFRFHKVRKEQSYDITLHAYSAVDHKLSTIHTTQSRRGDAKQRVKQMLDQALPN